MLGGASSFAGAGTLLKFGLGGLPFGFATDGLGLGEIGGFVGDMPAVAGWPGGLLAPIDRCGGGFDVLLLFAPIAGGVFDTGGAVEGTSTSIGWAEESGFGLADPFPVERGGLSLVSILSVLAGPFMGSEDERDADCGSTGGTMDC